MCHSAAEANVDDEACTSFNVYTHCPKRRAEDVDPVLARDSSDFGILVKIA